MARGFQYKEDVFSVHHTVDWNPNPLDYSIHLHQNYELFFFIQGIGSYMVEGAEYLLKPGTIILMRPSESHKLCIQPGQPYERIAVHFPETLLETIDPSHLLLEPYINRPLGQYNCYQSEELPISIREQIYDMCNPQRTPEEQRLTILVGLSSILLQLRTVYLQKQKRNNTGVYRDIAVSLVDYVNHHLYEDLSIDTVCEQLFLSRTYLQRLFKQATGTTMRQYITLKRLIRARKLLEEGKTAAQVCQLCGFSEYSTFYRAYLKQYGVSPTKEQPSLMD